MRTIKRKNQKGRDMTNKSSQTAVWLIGLGAVLVVGGVSAYVLTSQPERSSSTETTHDSKNSAHDDTHEHSKTSNDTPVASGSVLGTTIVFTDQGFEKDSYTVKKGQRVEVKNQSNTQLQFSSDSHPTHTDDTELNLSVLQPGGSASFTPNKVGEQGFHDHIQSQYTGLLKVTE